MVILKFHLKKETNIKMVQFHTAGGFIFFSVQPASFHEQVTVVKSGAYSKQIYAVFRIVHEKLLSASG